MNCQWPHDSLIGWTIKYVMTEQERIQYERLWASINRLAEAATAAEYREREEQLRILGAVPITNPM
jgi:hypothetical protein